MRPRATALGVSTSPSCRAPRRLRHRRRRRRRRRARSSCSCPPLNSDSVRPSGSRLREARHRSPYAADDERQACGSRALSRGLAGQPLRPRARIAAAISRAVGAATPPRTRRSAARASSARAVRVTKLFVGRRRGIPSCAERVGAMSPTGGGVETGRRRVRRLRPRTGE